MYNFVITPYIKSNFEKEDLKLKYNVKRFLSLQELSQVSTKNIFKIITSFSGNTLIYVSNKEESVFLNVMFLIFLFSTSFKVDYINEKGEITKYNKLKIMFFVFKTLLLTIYGVFLLFYSLILCFFHKKIQGSKINLNFKKALYLKSNFWVAVKAGGSVGHIEGILKGLEENDYKVTYLGLDNYSTNTGLTLILPLMNSSFFIEINACLFDYYFYKQIKEKNLSDQSFIYHRLSINSISALRYSRKRQIPLILEYNGSNVWVHKNWARPLIFSKLSEKIELTNLNNADLIVTVSQILKEELITKGIPEDKIVVYPNCVDPEKYNPKNFSALTLKNLRQSIGLNENDLVFTFIGTFGKWHGVEFLTETIQEIFLNEENYFIKNKIKFLFIGDGLTMPTVKQIISNTPRLENYIILLGMIEQEKAIPYLALSDVFLSPHILAPNGERFFGSPTKIFEYMAMAKPIIASNLDQQGEILNHLKLERKYEGVMLFEPENKEQLKDRIKKMVLLNNSLLSCSEETRNYVESYYTWDIHVKQILRKF